MEFAVSSRFAEYIIYRLPQVVGRSQNPKTLTNFIMKKLLDNEVLPVFKNAKRNLIDVDDVALVVDYINQQGGFSNQTVNLISLRNHDVASIVRVFECLLNKTANVNYLEQSEDNFGVCVSKEMRDVYEHLKIDFDNLYLEKILHKYYGGGND